VNEAKTKPSSPPTGSEETMALPSSGAVSSAVSSIAASTPGLAGTLGPQRLAGRYELMAMLGQGGMGTVYRARDMELDEEVALKMLRKELVDTPGMLERFRREAKLARRVTHKNVARTFDIGEHDGEKFLTMEFVDGESLAGLAARRGRLSVKEVAHIVAEICAGMSAAHAAGVVHRDLKPDNVLVAKDGRVVVTDFGIAHAAAGAAGVAKTMGGIVGTPAYMAPEQVEGGADVDARADIYALGAMTYELLTGHRAWPGEAAFVVAAARLLNPPPDPRTVFPSLPAAIAEVVMRCMAKARADRFASAAEVAAAFAAATGASHTSSLGLAPTSFALSAPPPPAAAVADGPVDKTVAVLPFKNGGPPEDEYLADGVTDDLIDVLSMTPGLRVRPRGAVAHLRGADRDPRHVGADLGVQVVVEGSVKKTPKGVRVTARLVSSSDGFQLWAKRFERAAGDVLAVNDEAANAIAEALTIAGAPKARVAPSDPVAIDLYLRATHEYRKFWLEDVKRAVDLYEQALERAPHDPTILAACARARARIAFFGGEGAATMLQLAVQAAERAVAGAPELGESWVALATVRFMGGDAAGAVRAAVTALGKSKGLAPAHEMLGRILVEAGRTDDALIHLRTALSIDPSNTVLRFELARAYALLGNWPEAERYMDVPVKLPGEVVSRYLFRTRLCLWRGEGHPDLDDPPVLGPEMGALGNPAELRNLQRTRELTESYRAGLDAGARRGEPHSRRRTLFFQINTEVYAYVFEIDHALAALAEAIESGLIDLFWLDRCPVLDAVRKDGRFAPLRAEVAERADRIIAALTP
jgi:TolB-like protein/tRNA A-37 threonylcarbamoyl transferase component Bud32